jgi:protein arginine kinase activator
MSEDVCDRCRSAPADVRYTQIKDGKMNEMRLCTACAQEMGLGGKAFKGGAIVHDLLHEVLPGTSDDEPGTYRSCPSCGLTYGQFRRTGRLGCEECYQAFHSELAPLFERIHRGIRHVGKSPDRTPEQRGVARRLAELSGLLDEAVKNEAFEEAARLRDQIRELEEAGGNGKEPRS